MHLLTPADVRSLLDAHGLQASRALGQNFLADPNTARRIARLAEVGPGDRVLEVGPGIGSLTLALLETGAEVLAIERDRYLLPVLAEVVGGDERFTIVEADALEADYDTLLGPAPSEGPGPWVMVSNLPYNIATPLIVHLLEAVPQLGRMLVMVQREVGERLAAPVGSRASGGVTVRVAYYAEAAVVARIPPTVFLPRPKVESVLVRLTRRPRPPVEVEPGALFEVVRAGFAHRRKTLRRALEPLVGKASRELLEEAGVDPSARAEELDLEAWASLARARAATR